MYISSWKYSLGFAFSIALFQNGLNEYFPPQISQLTPHNDNVCLQLGSPGYGPFLQLHQVGWELSRSLQRCSVKTISTASRCHQHTSLAGWLYLVMSAAWFLPNRMPGFHTNLWLIRPEKMVSLLWEAFRCLLATPLWAPMCFLLRRGSRQRVKARVFWNVLLSPLKSSVAPAIRFLVTPLTKALLSCPDGSVWMVGQPQEESCWFRTSSTYRSWTLHCCHWDLEQQNMFCSLPPVSV